MLFILKNRYIYLYRYTLEWAQGGKLKNNLPHTNQKWTKKKKSKLENQIYRFSSKKRYSYKVESYIDRCII